MELSTAHATGLVIPGPQVAQVLPESTSPVAGKVVGPV
jgi:hypothetical protein